MTRPVIVGAGMAGLLAANLLGNRRPIVYERQSSLPNNHRAILRFRSDVVARALCIPFRKVKVIKAVADSKGPVADALAYSEKVTGGLTPRSILDLAPVERFVAPPDLVERMAEGVDIVFSCDYSFDPPDLGPVISTVPMPALACGIKYPGNLLPKFRWRDGWNYNAKLDEDVDIHATVYFPHSYPFYRVSVVGNNVIAEGAGALSQPESADLRQEVQRALERSFGIYLRSLRNVEISTSKYQKLVDLDAGDRDLARRFISEASTRRAIHSLGRFATWRPKLLMDDLPNDIFTIARFLEGGTPYGAKP